MRDRHDAESAVAATLKVLNSTLVRQKAGDEAFEAERRALLERWPSPFALADRAAPHRLPVCQFIDEAVTAGAGGPAHDLLEAIAPLLADLRWSYGYPDRPDEPDFGSRIGFAQIIGPRGVMDHDEVHIGLTLMAPQTHYPLHTHPAVETYLILSGTADWRVEQEPFAARPPGSFIFHRSRIGHAMRTHGDSLLALYFWRGDLVTSPIYIDEPALPRA